MENVQEKINDAIEQVKSMPFGQEIDADGHRTIKLQWWNFRCFL